MSSEFTLYPEEKHWWSFNDYRAVLDTMRERKPARVLEFGPGSSTLALIEGGATHIDSCEDDPNWAQVYERRLPITYPVVHIHRYTWADPLVIPVIDTQRYDLALIDGPLGTDRRDVVVNYCLDRCTAVLAPTEDGNPRFREFLKALAAERGLQIEIRETGPLSGGFALLTAKPAGEATSAPPAPPTPTPAPTPQGQPKAQRPEPKAQSRKPNVAPKPKALPKPKAGTKAARKK